MRLVGNEIYIQQGETWSLDFCVVNDKGHPFTALKAWENPYLAITVATARYEQQGDYRETYWLDLNNRFVEQVDSTFVLEPLKRFTSNEVLLLDTFSIANVLSHYGGLSGNIILDRSSDFDVTNFLFYTDPNGDGNYTYMYVDNYILDGNGAIISQSWKAYDFRVIKQFDTRDWLAQGYLYDIKIVSGQSVQEYLCTLLDGQGVAYKDTSLWTNVDWENYIDAISDIVRRDEMHMLYDYGAPLMPTYDTRAVLLEPTSIYVNVNIQGGMK